MEDRHEPEQIPLESSLHFISKGFWLSRPPLFTFDVSAESGIWDTFLWLGEQSFQVGNLPRIPDLQNGPPCTMHGIVAPGLPLSYVSLGRREEVMTNRQESAVLVVFSPSGTGDTPACGCSTNTNTRR